MIYIYLVTRHYKFFLPGVYIYIADLWHNTPHRVFLCHKNPCRIMIVSQTTTTMTAAAVVATTTTNMILLRRRRRQTISSAAVTNLIRRRNLSISLTVTVVSVMHVTILSRPIQSTRLMNGSKRTNPCHHHLGHQKIRES